MTMDIYYSLAKQICDGLAGGDYVYCLEEDRFYQYKQGYWQHIYDYELIRNISEYALLLANKKIFINKFSLHARKCIIENMKVIKDLRLSCFNQAHLINFNNYMFDPVGINIANHDKNFYSNVRIPYSYDKCLDCPLWTKTLNQILEGDQKKLSVLQEFFGYCLTRDTKQHKALLLLGESRSGKSTILQILREIVGVKNCSSVPLKYISNPQYTPMLINKLVNIDTDVSAKASEFEAEFKTITSGEPVSCNQKFIATFEFVPFCKIVMAANIFPKITDHSSAFYKRLILIPCDRVFSDEEQNRNLSDQLKKELPGILNWAIEGLKRLNIRGRFEDCDFMREAVQQLEDENNPCNLFFEEHVEMILGTYIEKGELFNKYKEWSEKTKNYALSQNRFSTTVLKKFNKSTPKNARSDIGGKRIWKNIQYVHFKSSAVPITNDGRVSTHQAGDHDMEVIEWEK